MIDADVRLNTTLYFIHVPIRTPRVYSGHVIAIYLLEGKAMVALSTEEAIFRREVGKVYPTIADANEAIELCRKK